MNRSHFFGLMVLLVLSASLLFGCQQRPAVPTTAPEATEPVVVVVVTATSQPTLAPSTTPEATITPIPTLTLVVTQTVTATVRAGTPVAAATKPAATKAAVQPTAAEQPTTSAPPTTSPPTSFQAPQPSLPEGKTFREGDTISFQFSSVGPLGPNQCYRIDMKLVNPGVGEVGDWWVGDCGDQTAAGGQVTFKVYNRKQTPLPNYGSLIDNADAQISNTAEYQMFWTVTVVSKVDDVDPIHPKVQALSPASAALENKFSR